MTPALRPYQVAAVDGAEAAFANGTRAALVVQATGTGKTSAFAEVVRRYLAAAPVRAPARPHVTLVGVAPARRLPVAPRRVLVLAQRRELLDQASARLEAFGVRVVRGLTLGRAGVAHVASVQSAARRLATLPPDAFGLIVLDEAHHGCSPSHLAVLRHFPNARVLGLTATPDRADGASLGMAFEKCVARYDLAEAIRDGHLVPARGIRVDVDGLDLSHVRTKPITAEASSTGAWRDIADLHPGDLGRAAIVPAAVEGVVGPLLALTGTRRTVVFAVDRRHAIAITDSLNAHVPGCARVVHGGMRVRDRRAVLAQFAAGEFQYLINVLLLVEGWDLPAIECVALARPTTSRIFVAQACGRALRPAPGKAEALILDFTSATSKFSLVGPEDVLAGAFREPVASYRTHRKPAVEVALYVPQKRRTRFSTALVDLMRVVVRGVGRVVTGRTARKAGRAILDVLSRPWR